jgi:hypothetical protein
MNTGEPASAQHIKFRLQTLLFSSASWRSYRLIHYFDGIKHAMLRSSGSSRKVKYIEQQSDA